MNNIKPVTVVAGVMLVCAGIDTTYAQPPTGPQLSFDVTGASNYVFRGVSQTENNPAIFALARVKYDQFYATTGAESVDFNNGTNTEYDLSAGWTPTAAQFTFDLGVIRYGYIGAPKHIDTTELRAAMWHPLGPVTLGAAVNYTPNYFGTDDNGTYAETNVAYKIIGNLSASAAVGHQYRQTDDYTTWNVGTGYGITKSLAVDLRYYDTDEHASGKLYNSRFVASARISL